jgi:hypothetical protein
MRSPGGGCGNGRRLSIKFEPVLSMVSVLAGLCRTSVTMAVMDVRPRDARTNILSTYHSPRIRPSHHSHLHRRSHCGDVCVPDTQAPAHLHFLCRTSPPPDRIQSSDTRALWAHAQWARHIAARRAQVVAQGSRCRRCVHDAQETRHTRPDSAAGAVPNWRRHHRCSNSNDAHRYEACL